MKVYALERHYDYQGTTLLSIHATRESAEQKAQTHRDADEQELEFVQQTATFWQTWTSPEFHITEHEVES